MSIDLSHAVSQAVLPRRKSLVRRVFRVCDVVQFHSPISGGIRRYIEDKARAYAGAEDIEHAVLIPGPENRSWRTGRTTWVQVASPMIPGSRSYRLLLNRGALRDFLDCFQPRVVEVADPYQTAWMAFGWARRHNAKVVLFYHSDYPRAWHRSIKRFAGGWAAAPVQGLVGGYLLRLLNRADAVFVSTRKFERFWKQRCSAPVLRVPLGVDTVVFRPDERTETLRAGLGLAEGEALVFYAGRLAPEKRVPELLEGFAELLAGGVSARLVIAGDGEEREKLQRLAKKRALPVIWRPFLRDRAELAAHYSAADVLAHAGENETFGLSVLEAAACGTPAVVFAGSGLEEAASMHSLGKVVPRRGAAELAEGLRSILSRPISKDQRQIEYLQVAAQASLSACCERLRACYDEVVGTSLRRY